VNQRGPVGLVATSREVSAGQVVAKLESEHQKFELAIRVMQADALRVFEAHERGSDVTELLRGLCDAEYELLGDCDTFGNLAEQWGINVD